MTRLIFLSYLADHRLAALRGFIDPDARDGFASTVRASGFFRHIAEVIYSISIGSGPGQGQPPNPPAGKYDVLLIIRDACPGPSHSEISANVLEQLLLKHRPWMLTLCGIPLAAAEELAEKARLELESLRDGCVEGKGLFVKAFCLTAVRR